MCCSSCHSCRIGAQVHKLHPAVVCSAMRRRICGLCCGRCTIHAVQWLFQSRHRDMRERERGVMMVVRHGRKASDSAQLLKPIDRSLQFSYLDLAISHFSLSSSAHFAPVYRLTPVWLCMCVLCMCLLFFFGALGERDGNGGTARCYTCHSPSSLTTHEQVNTQQRIRRDTNAMCVIRSTYCCSASLDVHIAGFAWVWDATMSVVECGEGNWITPHHTNHHSLHCNVRKSGPEYYHSMNDSIYIYILCVWMHSAMYLNIALRSALARSTWSLCSWSGRPIFDLVARLTLISSHALLGYIFIITRNSEYLIDLYTYFVFFRIFVLHLMNVETLMSMWVGTYICYAPLDH